MDDSSAAVLQDTRSVISSSRRNCSFALTWCLILNHGPTAENDGISFYGVYHEIDPLLIGGYVVLIGGYVVGLSWCLIDWTYALTERLRTSF